jgi:hypothetical protein
MLTVDGIFLAEQELLLLTVSTIGRTTTEVARRTSAMS